MVHSLRRTFQKAQAIGREVGVTGIPVMRAQYSNPSVLTRYLTLGSCKTLFSRGMGTKRTVSTFGGCNVMVSQAVNNNTKNKNRPPRKQRNHAARMLSDRPDISAPEGNAKTNAPIENGWFAMWSQWCTVQRPGASTHTPQAAWPDHPWVEPECKTTRVMTEPAN